MSLCAQWECHNRSRTFSRFSPILWGCPGLVSRVVGWYLFCGCNVHTYIQLLIKLHCIAIIKWHFSRRYWTSYLGSRGSTSYNSIYGRNWKEILSEVFHGVANKLTSRIVQLCNIVFIFDDITDEITKKEAMSKMLKYSPIIGHALRNYTSKWSPKKTKPGET